MCSDISDESAFVMSKYIYKLMGIQAAMWCVI